MITVIDSNSQLPQFHLIQQFNKNSTAEDISGIRSGEKRRLISVCIPLCLENEEGKM
jgi:hypothetical protein